jgi:hypothetical protein
MTFPTVESGTGVGNVAAVALVPTARSFEPGDFPVKTYKAQNGAEHRILYGSSRTNMRLSLTYANIKDADAEQFLNHYETMQGTFQTFVLGKLDDDTSPARGGWEGNLDALGADASGNSYRYEGPPQVVQVRHGISTVTVNLIGVL